MIAEAARRKCPVARSVALLGLGLLVTRAAEFRNVSQPVESDGLPLRVHVFEDYETEIEKRWWLRGVTETNNLPPGSSDSVPNRRACRASLTRDFDDKMGDPTRAYKAVIFNPVPGPPMGANTRLSFRYWLSGTQTLRVQIYSLSKGCHRFLTLTNLPEQTWKSITVDMTRARRPDGSGGPLSEDERIDDIQFYIAAEAELVIDDIVLYEPGREEKAARFPKRLIFTGWFDTGKQGEGHEWPGEFEIVQHEPPFTWKAAKSVSTSDNEESWIRVHLRGRRPLSALNRLRFRYRLNGAAELKASLADTASGKEWTAKVANPETGRWSLAGLDFPAGGTGFHADEIRFRTSRHAELKVDDLLLYEP